MNFLKRLFCIETEKDKEEHRREVEGYTEWHPEYGNIYREPITVDFSDLDDNEPSFFS